MFSFRKQELALNLENWEFLKVEEFSGIFNKEVGQGHIERWNTGNRSRGLYQCGPLWWDHAPMELATCLAVGLSPLVP